jgi:hypothetical protein
MINDHKNRTNLDKNMQTSARTYSDKTLLDESFGVHGQRLRAQPETFWSYYPGDVGSLSKVCSCMEHFLHRHSQDRY